MFTEEGRKAYPEIAAAEDAVKEAEDSLRAAMAARFPKGRRVLVTHYHGSYYGEVRRTYDCRVFVENERTGRVTGRYPLIDTDGVVSVQLVD